PLLAGLTLEGETQAGAVDVKVPRAQRRQPEAPVLLRVDVVADPDHRVIEKPDNRGDHALPWNATPAQIGIDALAQSGQSAGEGGKAVEFGFIATRGPCRMIAILLAS